MTSTNDVADDCAPITVLLVVAVRLYREGLETTLRAQGQFRDVRTAGSAAEAVGAVRSLQPGVVIVDSSIADVFDLIATLRGQTPKTRILAFAVSEEIGTILRYAEAGADGFVTVNDSMSELLDAIERTIAGELLCSPRIAAQLLQRAAETANGARQRAGDGLLTSRELQVLSLLKQGRSNKEIGNALHIAEATVKNHVHHVLEKLQVATRGQAIALAGHPAAPSRRLAALHDPGRSAN